DDYFDFLRQGLTFKGHNKRTQSEWRLSSSSWRSEKAFCRDAAQQRLPTASVCRKFKGRPRKVLEYQLQCELNHARIFYRPVIQCELNHARIFYRPVHHPKT